MSATGTKNTGCEAIVVQRGATTAIVLRAQGLPPNTKPDAYAVWLSSPGGKSTLLGFVNPAGPA